MHTTEVINQIHLWPILIILLYLRTHHINYFNASANKILIYSNCTWRRPIVTEWNDDHIHSNRRLEKEQNN